MKEKTRFLTRAALIAAIYVVLTGISYFAGLDKGVIQFRISEALCFLPCFLPAAIPGLSIGCLISNIIYGGALPDIIFGTLATLIGAVLTRLLTRGLLNSSQSGASLRFRLAAVLPPIISNTIIVPLVLKFAYMYDDALYFMAFTVCLGEIIGIGIIGNILITVLSRQNILSQLMKYSDCRA